jgi:hypothetical protein
MVQTRNTLAGTGELAKAAVQRSSEIKSLPTQVHVKPTSINVNGLRSECDMNKYSPTVLIG